MAKLFSSRSWLACPRKADYTSETYFVPGRPLKIAVLPLMDNPVLFVTTTSQSPIALKICVRIWSSLIFVVSYFVPSCRYNKFVVAPVLNVRIQLLLCKWKHTKRSSIFAFKHNYFLSSISNTRFSVSYLLATADYRFSLLCE